MQMFVTFAEVKEYRAMQVLLVEQAGLENQARRRKRAPVVRDQIRFAIAEKASLGVKTTASNANIRQNRSNERAAQRSAGFNGVLNETSSCEPARSPALASEPVLPLPLSPISAGNLGASALALWGEIDPDSDK